MGHSLPQTFPKSEHLCRKKLLTDLFKDGSSFVVHPFRVVWMEVELPEPVPVQMAISVPKRKLKHAVQRNYVKRLIREAYRHEKHIHYRHFEGQEKQCAMMLIYLGGERPDYNQIHDKIILTLQRLVKKAKGTSGQS